MSHNRIDRGFRLPPVAVVSGLRTPFVKAFGPMSDVSADELGRTVVEAALSRCELQPNDVGELVFGNVAGPAESANIARVIAMRAGIPHDRPAHTVNRNCASGMESIISGWQILSEGRADVVVAGGTESMSNIPLLWNPEMQRWLIEFRKASLAKRLRLLAKIRPRFFKPVSALVLGLTDPISGLNMGQTAEILAKEFRISRADQDEFALRSHQLVTAAWERCFFRGEVVPVSTRHGEIDQDVGPRANQSPEALAKLKPIFDRHQGTITPGNSCPITDGAVAVVLMRPEQAQGREVLGYLRGYAVAGCDPSRMGLGPVFATHKLLESTGLSLQDFELFEMTEAFAAQVLACLSAFASREFAERELGRSSPIGEVDRDRLNVNGGAIALGHPVGATGTRLILTLLRALKERGANRGLASLCVGGGQGAAVWVERTLEDES